MSNYDKIFKALCKLSSSTIVSLHDEAKGDVVKTFQGDWKTIQFTHANELAGLGKVNQSLL